MVTTLSAPALNREILTPECLSTDNEAHYRLVENVVGEMRRSADAGGLSLNEMADVAHLSPYHFARTFRRVTGIPPGEFMNALRLERAKRLLLTTDLSVGEVCHEIGYNSQGTFTSRFTKLVGLPPTQMRTLQERLELAREQISEYGSIGPRMETGPAAKGVAGRIEAPGIEPALIFAGLFHGAIPQRGPVCGVMLTVPGDFVLSGAPDGVYHLMAAAVPLLSGSRSLLMPDDTLRVGRAQRPIQVRGGIAAGRATVALRPMLPTDPPLLTPLPMLLVERLNSMRPESAKRAR